MPILKNVRPGVLIIADANLRLGPGETIDAKTTTPHTAWAINKGYLVKVDATSDENESPQPSDGKKRVHNRRKAVLNAINKKQGEPRAAD